jgi:putative heme-binding domain-containing protein
MSCAKNEKEGNQITFSLPQDFAVEDLYQPSAHGQGSWVAITESPDSTFFVCDQYGKIYFFQKPGLNELLKPEDVDSLDLNIGYAQGLLWAFNSLYVVVVKRLEDKGPENLSSGVFRMSDSDGDGTLEKVEKILEVDGYSEHGPHTMRIGPDGKSLYLIAGNFNSVPTHFKSRLPKTWAEDNLFDPYLDARGHAVDLKAPGGWIAKTDPEGKEWELIAAGFRNPFSFGFNSEGELFTYDADMEWDFGMPWYRPTRILHVTSGAEFGWRTGSGKWPVYYPDNLPPVVNMSQGSPTAVVMGKDLSFPTRYRDGLFACDWSFGTIYYVDLKPEGSTYLGAKEEFLSATPLPISNAIAANDGQMYFLTGGRRLESHLYRVRYMGSESADSEIKHSDKTEELRNLRKRLENFHGPDKNENLPLIWEHLGHEDQFISYAARIALEHQPISVWEKRLWVEKEPAITLNATLAYVRSGGALNQQVINMLCSLEWNQLNESEKISLLRIYSLLLIRNGSPSPDISSKIITCLDSYYPNENPKLNRELSQILLYLDAPNALPRTIKVLKKSNENEQVLQAEILDERTLARSEQYGPQIADMIAAMPPTEAIHYVTLLSRVKNGWTPELRKEYFTWFYEALSGKGGESYKPFLDNIRAKALENVPDSEKEYFQNLAGYYSPVIEMSDLPKPIGPGKEYNLYDLGELVLWGDDKLEDYSGSIEDGKRAYQAALCYSCHRMKGDGGASGPDLTNLHTRFAKSDIANAILSPNDELSEQYAFTLFKLKNGELVSGRIVGEDKDSYEIYQSPFDMTRTIKVLKSDIENRRLSPLSPMPARLLNGLNEKEVKDLMVYLLSGSNPKSEFYN